MSRATGVFFAGAGAVGLVYVFGFTMARATPPRWASAVALVVVLAALAAYVYELTRGGDPEAGTPDAR